MLTQHRNLRTGLPLWLDRPPRKILSSKTLSRERCDVVIVGTGISGALVADALLNAGLSVIAVDRRKPMAGSTPASTALLQFEIDTPLTKLQKKIGINAAARAWWRSIDAVRALGARIEDLGISCGYHERTTLYLPGNEMDAKALKREAAERTKLGMRSSFLGRDSLRRFSGLRKAGAILSAGNGEADPVRLVAGLWRSFVARGGRLVSDVEITEVDQSRSSVRLKSKDGSSISARNAIFCTGYELMPFAKPKGYKIISTWVLATKMQPKNLWPSRSLIWEAADPYLYLRTTEDGRIIAGGEDEPFADADKRDALIPKKIAAIARKAKRMFPNADFEPQFAWAGSFGESPTGLPAIGPIPHLSRCYEVLGFGGNGITFSMLAAQLVSRHIQGITDPDAELFALADN